jgi:hypothetical protein
MLIALTHISAIENATFHIGSLRTSLSVQPGLAMDFDPDSGLVFVSHGSDVHVIPQSAIKQMRVAPDAIAELREFLRTRAPKRPAAGGKAA